MIHYVHTHILKVCKNINGKLIFNGVFSFHWSINVWNLTWNKPNKFYETDIICTESNHIQLKWNSKLDNALSQSKSNITQSFSACRTRKLYCIVIVLLTKHVTHNINIMFYSDYPTYRTYSNHTSQQKFIVDKNTSNAKIGAGKSASSLWMIQT